VEVNATGDLRDEHGGHSHRSHMLVDTEEVNFSHNDFLLVDVNGDRDG